MLSLHCSAEPTPRGRARTAWSVMDSSILVTTSSRMPRYRRSRKVSMGSSTAGSPTCRCSCPGTRQPAQARAQPLGVRRPTPFEQMCQVHRHSDQASRDHSGAELVAALRGSADGRQLLSHPRPIGRHDLGPLLVRVPREALARCGQVTCCVEENRTGGHLQDGLSGKRQSVGGRQRT